MDHVADLRNGGRRRLAKRRAPFTCRNLIIKQYGRNWRLYTYLLSWASSKTRSHPSALLTHLTVPPWLLSPRFRSWTRHETRVFTTGLLNSILSPYPNFKMTAFGATTLRPFASRNSSRTISTSSFPRLLPRLNDVIPTAIMTHAPLIPVTRLYSRLLSHCFKTRSRTYRKRRVVPTSRMPLTVSFAR